MHAASPSKGNRPLMALVKAGTSSLLTVTLIPTNVLSVFWASLGCTQTTDHSLDTSDSQKLASAPFGDQGNP